MVADNIFEKDFVILDGAMGTMLQSRGLKIGGIPEVMNITNPEVVTDIHKEYVSAGSNIVYTNTFGANRYKMKDCGYSVEELIGAAVSNAKKACEGKESIVALDIGPIGQLLEPTGNLSFEEAYDMFKQEVRAGQH